MTFLLSPIIDNLTAALVMCAVVLSVGRGNRSFAAIGCVNIVVAANAGGAFSPFGDITTLMVWQSGLVEFQTFLALALPSVVNCLVPAAIMSFAVSREVPEIADSGAVTMKRGAKGIMFLFLCTIVTAVSFHNFLHLPPFLGMMMGLSYLKIFSYYLKRTHVTTSTDQAPHGVGGDVEQFDSYRELARAEWDTLIFFFGVIMCVGGLGFIGYLDLVSQFLYLELGPTAANILVGFASAIVDNIPVMVAVLQMNPEMDLNQWLLVTLTAGVGGSMLAVGSAAGVAVMGQARGIYTFFGHLKWAPAILLGYVLSIWIHLLINGRFIGACQAGNSARTVWKREGETLISRVSGPMSAGYFRSMPSSTSVRSRWSPVKIRRYASIVTPNVAVETVAAIMNMIMIWYRTASSGAAPARI
jgi:Na+/H+ antiporter NhaD/arsenite permease-like protein